MFRQLGIDERNIYTYYKLGIPGTIGGAVAMNAGIEIQSKRVSTQPLNYSNAGSIFKRISGCPVGAIIENAGLKNTTIGGAKGHCSVPSIV